MSEPVVLVVDDDESVRTYLSDFLSPRGFRVEQVESGEEAIGRLASPSRPDLILLDIVLPGVGGLEVLEQVTRMESPSPVIMLSVIGQIRTVVEAMKAGASDYLVKPFEEEELLLAIEKVLEKYRLKEEVKSLRAQLKHYSSPEEIPSVNPRVQRIKEIAKQVADADVPVLILGESGVGKGVLAHFIQSQSARRDKRYVKVNCAALPHDLLESEVFGYERGAFTGAFSEKPGKFELADKGTLLLDEIGDMSPPLQAKLLHVLQDGEYMRLGGSRSIKADARVLATTHKRLEEAVAKGEFREDLYFRLNVVRIEIPPLRERTEDIPLLCNYFLEKYCEKYKSTVRRFPPELLDAFVRYDWPGNVRELENAVKQFLILGSLGVGQFLKKKQPARLANGEPATEAASLKEVAAQAAEQAEKELALRVLERNYWNRKRAAQELGISYKALLNKLKRWGPQDSELRS